MCPFPEIPSGLLSELERLFPDKSPRSDVGAFSFGKVAGQQEVLDLLRDKFHRQQEARHVPR